MNWIEMINFCACIVLLYYLLIAAVFTRRTGHRLAIAPFSFVVALQTVDPLVGWIPQMMWPAVAFNVSLVIVIVLLSGPLWKMVRAL